MYLNKLISTLVNPPSLGGFSFVLALNKASNLIDLLSENSYNYFQEVFIY